MELKEPLKARLEKSAEEAKLFWDGVKRRIPSELLGGDDQFRVIDIQEISDNCIDLVLLRNSSSIEIEQLEHWRIVAEKRWFKKPKIRMYFLSGPFSNEFFDKK